MAKLPSLTVGTDAQKRMENVTEKKNITFSLSVVIFPHTFRRQQNIQAFHN